ncbi:unnamed protein product [Arctogadus glacialis]
MQRSNWRRLRAATPGAAEPVNEPTGTVLPQRRRHDGYFAAHETARGLRSCNGPDRSGAVCSRLQHLNDIELTDADRVKTVRFLWSGKQWSSNVIIAYF